MYRKDLLFLYTDPPARFRPKPSLVATRSCSQDTCTLKCIMTGKYIKYFTHMPQKGQ